MKYSLFTHIFILLLCIAISCRMAFPQSAPDTRQIHHRAFVIDTHTDTPMKLLEGANLSLRHDAPDYRVDFPRLREGDIDGVFFAIYTGQRKRTDENYKHAYDLALRMLDSTLTAVDKNSNTSILALSSGDILDAANKDKTAIYLGLENGFPLSKDISRVEEFYKKGIRYITLCHTSNNDLCDSSTDPKGSEHSGLSDFGREVVAEMNRLGMIVDVSHISDKSFYDVLESSKVPVIASHSSVRALCDHPRNLSDDMIRALAKNGGVIQICILGDYLIPKDTTTENYRKINELRLKYNNWRYKDDDERKEAWHARDSVNKYFPPVLPTIAQAVDHIDHVIKLVGPDYVGIGSDFDGGGGLADCADVSAFPKITAELVRRGYSQDEIDKIWGGNFLRVFREVEQAAAVGSGSRQ